jgi:hypothetical protein
MMKTNALIDKKPCEICGKMIYLIDHQLSGSFLRTKYCHRCAMDRDNALERRRRASLHQKNLCEKCGRQLGCPLFSRNEPSHCQFWIQGYSNNYKKIKDSHFDWNELDKYLKWEESLIAPHDEKICDLYLEMFENEEKKLERYIEVLQH